MKRINDGRLYFYFAIITTVLAAIMGAIAYYSILLVEPEIRGHIDAKEDVGARYRSAYVMLRDPQIFARYENFDAAGMPAKTILRDFDKRMYKNEPFTADDRIYLEFLLERRMQGSRLTRGTMVFFALLSILGWGAFFHERRKASAL